MLSYIDTLPDLQFMSIFIAVLIVSHFGQLLFNRWLNKGTRR